MKPIRLVGAISAAVLTMALMLAPGAFAAHYLFRSADVGATFTGKSLGGTLKAGANAITCTSDVNSGAIANVHLIGPFVIHFLGCTSTGATKSGCTANSIKGGVEQTGGLILTETVHALLGLVLPSGLPGLLVLPTSGKRFVTIAANACTIERAVTGTIAGLIPLSQIGKPVLESLVNFIANGIREIDTLNGLVEPELILFATEATLETQEHLEWSRAIEIF